MDWNLTVTTIPLQIGPDSYRNDLVLHIDLRPGQAVKIGNAPV